MRNSTCCGRLPSVRLCAFDRRRSSLRAVLGQLVAVADCGNLLQIRRLIPEQSPLGQRQHPFERSQLRVSPNEASRKLKGRAKSRESLRRKRLKKSLPRKSVAKVIITKRMPAKVKNCENCCQDCQMNRIQAADAANANAQPSRKFSCSCLFDSRMWPVLTMLQEDE